MERVTACCPHCLTPCGHGLGCEVSEVACGLRDAVHHNEEHDAAPLDYVWERQVALSVGLECRLQA
eukprot:229380-Prymnesium_polylepis.4